MDTGNFMHACWLSPYSFVLVFELALTFASSIATADSNKSEDLFEMDLETLLTIKVGPSADASAKGLCPVYNGGQIAEGGRIGILSVQDAMDTPFSVTHYTHEFIQNHQAASVGDVLQYDPSVRVARGFGNFQQVYMLRGLPIFSDDMTYNGLYGILPRQYLAAELIERVEILRGANAFLNGAAPGVSGSLGGAVDVIPKRAPKEDIAEVTVGVQTASQHYLATDLAQRSTDGSFGVRLNAVDSGGNTAVSNTGAMDKESHELGMATLGADYRGTNLRVSADLGYQDHRINAAQPNITIANNLPLPDAPDASRNIAQPWTYSNEHDLFGTLRTEYDFTKNITGWIAGGARTSKENSVLSVFLTVNNSAGDYSANRFDVIHEDDVMTGDMGLRIKFLTHGIQHTLTLSANAYSNDSSNAYLLYDAFNDNIYHPEKTLSPTTILFAGGNLNRPRVTATTRTSSLAIADEIALLDNRLLFTLGARQQHLRETSRDYNNGQELSDYDQSRMTPLATVVYKFTPQYSLYANYIEGLLKGDIAPTTNSDGPVANAGQSLKPYQTRQTEIGFKYDATSIGASIDVFNIRKPLAGYNSNNALMLVDSQQHWGSELSVYGKLTPALKLLAGISYLDTDINGKNAIGAPKVQANLGLEWDVPQLSGLSLNGHIMYTGTQYANTENTQKNPAWSRLDLGARYTTKILDSHTLTLRANIENVTDQNYWASVGGFPGQSYLTLGNPRTLLVYATVDF